MPFTPQKVRELHDALNVTLREFSQEHGVTVTSGRFMYGSNEIRSKIEIYDAQQADGSRISKERFEWEKYCRFYGLMASDFGKTLTTFDGDSIILCGMSPRAKKYPILAKRRDGKVFKWTAVHIARMINEQHPCGERPKNHDF